MESSGVKLIPGRETKSNNKLKVIKQWLKYNFILTLVLFTCILVTQYFIWSTEQKIKSDLLRTESMIEDSFEAVKRSQVKLYDEITLDKFETESKNFKQLKNKEPFSNKVIKTFNFEDYQDNFKPGLEFAQNSNTIIKKQELEDAYSEIDRLLYGNVASIIQAIDMLEKLYYQNPNSTDTLVRLSDAYFYLGSSAEAKNDLGKLDYYTAKGMTFVMKALELNESCVHCLLNHIRIYGLRMDQLGTLADKFLNIYKIDADFAKITEIDPNYYFLDHYHATRKLRIAQLSWVQRNLGKLLLGSFDFSYNFGDIINRLEKNYNRMPKIYQKRERFFIGQAYFLSGDKNTGFKIIEQAKNMPVISPLEEVGEKLINEFLEAKKLDYERYKESQNSQMGSNSTITTDELAN